MGPKLQWVHELASSAGLGMACSITVTLEDHCDPLKKMVVLTFGDKLIKGDYAPLQKMAHWYAKANDCTLERIRRRPNALVLEILIKNRQRPTDKVMAKNPLKEE